MNWKTYLTKKNVIIGVIILIVIGAIGSIFDNEEKSETKAVASVSKKQDTSSDKIVLFKDYTFGMTPEQVKEISGAGSCDDPELQDALCSKKKVKFGGYDWEQIFVFSGHKLSQVILHKGDCDAEETASIMQTIINSDYSVALMENGIDVFDALSSIKANGLEASKDEYMQFLFNSAQNDAPLTIYFFPNDYMKKMHDNKVTSVLASLTKAPDGLRVIELSLTEDEAALMFETPVALAKAGQKRAVKEKF